MQWTERDGVVFFTVTSDGTDTDGWIKRLEAHGYTVRTQELLRKESFFPTRGVEYEIAVMRNLHFFRVEEPYINIVRDKARRLGFQTPSLEIAYLIRAQVSDDDLARMGFKSIAVVHDAVKDNPKQYPDQILFTHVSREMEGRILGLFYNGSTGRFVGPDGYAFVNRRSS